MPARSLAMLLLFSSFTSGLAAEATGVAQADPGVERYENTFRKDFVMDAPWRVRDELTAIPITIVLKDCDTDDIRELHWIRCWDVTGGETLIWDHDFGDETIGDDPHESNFWTYITTVTEGHAVLPNGTPLTPANLGHGPGDAINLRVEVYYKDNWFNYTETRHLRVHVGHGDYPWPDGWYGGDTHFHTMYTNNVAEFGAPLPAVELTARAVGLHWLTATDHSCDLDETGDGTYSYATTHWEYTIQNETGIHASYRDNTAIGTTWDVLGEEVPLFDSPDFRLYRGVELNAASVDAGSFDKTLHCLIYNEDYIHSPLSGAFGERPVFPPLPEALGEIAADGFAYAAHPLSDMSAEWGGLDWGINGAAWGHEDYVTGLGNDVFAGLEAFNTRRTRYSSDVSNPWPDFDAGLKPDDPHPAELLVGVELWDEYLAASLGDPVRKVFLSGGSDAHGDFNFSTHLALDSYATDNAIGKVQTVVFVSDAGGSGHGPGNLPPSTEIMAALREGRSVVTDGPFIEIGVDRNGDGDFTDENDLMIADHGIEDTGGPVPMTVRWKTIEGFGPLTSVELIAANQDSLIVLLSLNPCDTGEGWFGERVVDVGSLGFSVHYYFRAQCLAGDAADGFRALTNPIWCSFQSTHVAASETERVLALTVHPNPFRDLALIHVRTGESDGPVSLSVYDVSGRLVKRFHPTHGTSDDLATVLWDGRDVAGRELASGVYLIRLSAGEQVFARKAVLVR